MLENLKPHPILVYRDVSFNQNTIQRPPPPERLEHYIKATTECQGSPHRDELEDSMKVELWAGVAQRG